MACDICGKTGTRLEDLMECYQTDDIKQVCPQCVTEINKKLDPIKTMARKIVNVLFKRFLREKKSAAQTGSL